MFHLKRFIDGRTNILGKECHSPGIQTKMVTQEASEFPSSHGHIKYTAKKWSNSLREFQKLAE